MHTTYINTYYVHT